MDAAWPPGPPDRACLVLDFDGTLAPIVDDPTTSALPPPTGALLVRLAARLGRVAVVSGRPASFLAQRVLADGAPVAGVRLVGLYGLEQVVDGDVVPDPRVEAHLPALDAARGELAGVVAAWPGTRLEDKGRALALHWRQAEDPAGAAEALTAAVRRCAAAGEGPAPLQVEDGKQVVELRPPVPADKGTAVRALVDDLSGGGSGTSAGAGGVAVCYCGDDLGDLPAFAAVRELGGVAVAVDHGAETHPRVRDAADVVVDGPDGLAAWLADVAERVGA